MRSLTSVVPVFAAVAGMAIGATACAGDSEQGIVRRLQVAALTDRSDAECQRRPRV